MQNIILVGFMGTGKTSIGRELAKRRGMEFIDLDDVIEEREHMKIADIFKEKGEPYFRQAEREAVRDVCGRKNLIVAAGGGAVLKQENVGDFASCGIVVCLEARPEIIVQRTSGHAHRPLLNVAQPIKKIRELLEKRKSHYDKIADHIDTSDMSLEEAVEKIMELVSRKINATFKDHPPADL